MLPATNRLVESDTFRVAVRRGRRAGTSLLVVHLWTDDQAASVPPEVGFTVGKTVGNAVVRNHVKRRLRHLTRKHLPQLQAFPGRVVLVVRALPAAATASAQELNDDLARALARVTRPQAA